MASFSRIVNIYAQVYPLLTELGPPLSGLSRRAVEAPAFASRSGERDSPAARGQERLLKYFSYKMTDLLDK
ncbi:hypothetical protein NDU88_003744 [Pleurodeles waltl]|uniref:Uncharacterized protein n=1 Tax=Pleurodeles waltl TaxID=8319 RepID=A0AAV7NRR2_PLEWA|nr:hypothetical protein NDU88_003744 [Pleurodeles waltl]